MCIYCKDFIPIKLQKNKTNFSNQEITKNFCTKLEIIFAFFDDYFENFFKFKNKPYFFLF